MSEEAQQHWLKTGTKNLFKLQESGIYYGRVKRDQTNYRKSFKTTSYVVACRELAIWLASFEAPERPKSNGTLGGMVELYFADLANKKILGTVADRTIDYKRETIDQIRRTWQGFDKFPLEDLTKDQLKKWRIAHRAKYSPTRTNGAVTVLRELCRLAVDEKQLIEDRWEKLERGLSYVPLVKTTMQLPEPDQVERLRNEVYLRSSRHGTCGGWLFDFLLFSGARIESATEVRWEDVKWGSGELYFRKAKRNHNYTVPLFDHLRGLLDRMKAANPEAKPTDKILPTESLKRVLGNACKDLKLSHLSHHDLRHLFATRCIEAGVDIPTISRWLGHQDGGALAMKTYGHLRKEHSQAQAAKVDFLPKQKTQPQESPK